jgi:hypothetical protein
MKLSEQENMHRHQRPNGRVLGTQECVALFLMRFAASLDFSHLAVFFAVAPSTVTYIFSCILVVMVETHKGQISWPDADERARLKTLAVDKYGPLCTGIYNYQHRFYFTCI